MNVEGREWREGGRVCGGVKERMGRMKGGGSKCVNRMFGREREGMKGGWQRMCKGKGGTKGKKILTFSRFRIESI